MAKSGDKPPGTSPSTQPKKKGIVKSGGKTPGSSDTPQPKKKKTY